MSPCVTGTPRNVNSVSCDSIRSGTPRCEPPSQSRPTFCRMNEKPTAVISGASLGALRSGLYATRSIITLSVPQHDHRDEQDHEQAEDQAQQRRSSTVSPIVPIKEKATKLPIMKRSPWAKLMSSMMP